MYEQEWRQRRMKRFVHTRRQHSSSFHKLDLQSQLASCEEKLSRRETVANITSRLKDRDLTSVSVIDLSVNNLLTQDLQHIYELLKLTPNCKVLDLSNNRIGYQSMSETILALQPILNKGIIINISRNDIMTTAGIQYLKDLSVDQWCHLIFYSRVEDANLWSIIVPEDNILRDRVRSAHIEFFERYPNIIESDQ